MKKGILFEMSKVANPNSGLGQFCLNLGAALIRNNLNCFDLYFLMPESSFGVFGKQVNYIAEPRSQGIDLVHLLHQDALNLKCNCKKVITVHDVNFVRKYFAVKRAYKTYKLRKKLLKADSLVFISRFACNDSLRHLNIPKAENTQIIYNGLPAIPQPVPPLTPPTVRPFFFNLNIVSEKKKVHTLLPLMRFLPQFDLVVAGNLSSGYARKLLSWVSSSDLKNRIFFVGEIGENSKAWYYQNCQAFLFPSTNEGFGLPVLEAMSFGKPVFCSRASSLPEIAGFNAFYWGSHTPEAMAKVVIDGLNQWSEVKSAEAKSHALSFSWDAAAEQYFALYKNLLYIP